MSAFLSPAGMLATATPAGKLAARGVVMRRRGTSRIGAGRLAPVCRLASALLVLGSIVSGPAAADDAAAAAVAGDQGALAGAAPPLPSWNDTAARERIISFVRAVTTPGGPDFVPVGERIAVFDNDGTLWSEKPLYFQLLYAIAWIEAHAAEHPEWRDRQPFKAVLDGDRNALAAAGEPGIVELVMASHAGMTTTEFDASVREFLQTARHPEKQRLYPELVFQPMLELLGYLRANGFTTWTVSGGGADFVRVFSEQAYGIPPERVVGSRIAMAFEMRPDGPVIVRQPKIEFVDDRAGKPVGIQQQIGRRPIAAFGNSDGDLQMLQWTAAGGGRRLLLLVHHTDGEREWAYDRQSSVGKLDVALDQAEKNGWVVVDMKKDWKVVYPFETPP